MCGGDDFRFFASSGLTATKNANANATRLLTRDMLRGFEMTYLSRQCPMIVTGLSLVCVWFPLHLVGDVRRRYMKLTQMTKLALVF